jgi:hypothetical protein
MIILRQREFGRTGLNKEQAKQFFKGGQGKINKVAKKLFESESNRKRDGIDSSSLSRDYPRTNFKYDIQTYGRDNVFRPAKLSKLNKMSNIDEAINQKAEYVGGRPSMNRSTEYWGKITNKSKILHGKDKASRIIYDHGKVSGGRKVGYFHTPERIAEEVNGFKKMFPNLRERAKEDHTVERFGRRRRIM